MVPSTLAATGPPLAALQTLEQLSSPSSLQTSLSIHHCHGLWCLHPALSSFYFFPAMPLLMVPEFSLPPLHLPFRPSFLLSNRLSSLPSSVWFLRCKVLLPSINWLGNSPASAEITSMSYPALLFWDFVSTHNISLRVHSRMNEPLFLWYRLWGVRA